MEIYREVYGHDTTISTKRRQCAESISASIRTKAWKRSAELSPLYLRLRLCILFIALFTSHDTGPAVLLMDNLIMDIVEWMGRRFWKQRYLGERDRFVFSSLKLCFNKYLYSKNSSLCSGFKLFYKISVWITSFVCFFVYSISLF